jgi:hypothetical protein
VITLSDELNDGRSVEHWFEDPAPVAAAVAASGRASMGGSKVNCGA